MPPDDNDIEALQRALEEGFEAVGERIPSPTFTLVLTPSAPGVHGLELTVGRADFQRAMDRGDIVALGPFEIGGDARFQVMQPTDFGLGGGSVVLALGTRFSIRQSTTYHTVRPGVTHPNRGALGVDADEVIEVITPSRPEFVDPPFRRPGITTQEFHTPDHSTAGLELPPPRLPPRVVVIDHDAFIRHVAAGRLRFHRTPSEYRVMETTISGQPTPDEIIDVRLQGTDQLVAPDPVRTRQLAHLTRTLQGVGLSDAQIDRVRELVITPGSGIELAQDTLNEELDQRMGRAMRYEATTRVRIPRRDATTLNGQVLGEALRVAPPSPVIRSVWERLGDDDIE